MPRSARDMSIAEMLEAEERGRARAEQMVFSNPDAKARVETKFGVDYCRRRYPLAYQLGEGGESAGSGSGA